MYERKKRNSESRNVLSLLGSEDRAQERRNTYCAVSSPAGLFLGEGGGQSCRVIRPLRKKSTEAEKRGTGVEGAQIAGREGWE